MLPCQGYSKRLRSRVWETPKIEKWRSSRQSETPIFPVCGHTGCACYSASHSGMASTIFRKCTYTCCACYSLKSHSPLLLNDFRCLCTYPFTNSDNCSTSFFLIHTIAHSSHRFNVYRFAKFLPQSFHINSKGIILYKVPINVPYFIQNLLSG